MKIPEKTKRYCPHCKKQTLQEVSVAKQKGRSSAHPMSRWSRSRARTRGQARGYGNLGRFSKPPVKDWNRKSKSTRRLTILYKCTICKKIKGAKKAIRVSRIEIGEKVSK